MTTNVCGHTIPYGPTDMLVCVLDPGHDGSHADKDGETWYAAPSKCRHCGAPITLLAGGVWCQPTLGGGGTKCLDSPTDVHEPIEVEQRTCTAVYRYGSAESQCTKDEGHGGNHRSEYAEWHRTCAGCDAILEADSNSQVCGKCDFVDDSETKEAVNHPDHYNKGGLEVVDVWDAFDLGRYECQVVKYVLRAKFKSKELEDLKKAAWYLNRRIEQMETDGG